MSVEQSDVVDGIAVPEGSTNAFLLIADYLPWTAENEDPHLEALVKKINAYLRFLQSGEIFRKHPEAKGRTIVIKVVGTSPLSGGGRTFFGNLSASFAGRGVALEFELFRAN